MSNVLERKDNHQPILNSVRARLESPSKSTLKIIKRTLKHEIWKIGSIKKVHAFMWRLIQYVIPTITCIGKKGESYAIFNAYILLN